MTGAKTSAFTLIELLVVITIIVVLLAMLTPALDKAIYQAELVKCAGNMRAGAQGGLQYAFDNKRYYTTHGASGGWMPDFLRQPAGSASVTDATATTDYDLITLLRSYTGLAVFSDPFINDIDLEPSHNDAITQLVAENCWYGGWGGTNWRMSRKMNKIGDRMEYLMEGEKESHTSSVLVSDMDIWDPVSQAYAEHKDEAGGLKFERKTQNDNNPWFFNLPVQKVTQHWWEEGPNISTPLRGPIDSNYAFDDASVLTYKAVEIADDRMWRVQDGPNLGSYIRGQHLPKTN